MTLVWVLGAVLACAVIRYGAVLEVDRWVMALGVGVAVIACFLRKRRYELAPLLEPWLRWPLGLLAAYGVAQLAPLPPAVLRALSPARAEIAAATGGGWAPLTVAPAHTLFLLMTLGACLLTLLAAREAAWRLEQRAWLAAVPIVVIAALEAGLGLAQYYSNYPDGVAHGTWVNRNHFAGFLEMGLMLAVGIGIEPQRTRRTQRRAIAMVAAAVILAGIIHSLSRMGFTAALFGLAVGAMALAGKRARLWAAVAAAVAVAGLFVYLPPDRLVARFAELAATEEISADQRVEIWRETLGLIRAYPVFGCGLGGYEGAFLKYKRVAPMNTVDYAHNDYLQGQAELGAAGMALCLVLAAGVFRKAGSKPAVAAALAAIALHSLVDFNLYIPANAMTAAWVAGLGASD
jgi:O-antigen ligase